MREHMPLKRNNMVNMSILDGNTIELHYWFNDGSHTMSATILVQFS